MRHTVTIAALAMQAMFTWAQPLTKAGAVKIVKQIQRADYEGDRLALKHFYDDLLPYTAESALASRIYYWRGFALWRRVLNGFNDGVDAKEQEHDLEQAIQDFEKAIALDPAFVDAKIGVTSCLALLVGQSPNDPARTQKLIARGTPFRKESEAEAPGNPRLLWVLGSIFWYVPEQRGGGQAKAIATYEQGLQAARKLRGSVKDPLEPSWGEPELLMSLAGSYLYSTTPDLRLAEQYAKSTLKLVPYWHYVRDILLPQIQKRQI